MPATLPSVMAVPIKPLAQPCDCRKTPTNGPMPDCMSAMKKFNASSGQSGAGFGDRTPFLLAFMTSTLAGSTQRRHPNYSDRFRPLQVDRQNKPRRKFDAGVQIDVLGKTDRTNKGRLRDQRIDLSLSTFHRRNEPLA
jgi:hypothetical protein